MAGFRYPADKFRRLKIIGIFNQIIFANTDYQKIREYFATENKLDVNAFKVGLNESLSGMVKEELEFTKQYDMAGDMIYLNPSESVR